MAQAGREIFFEIGGSVRVGRVRYGADFKIGKAVEGGGARPTRALPRHRQSPGLQMIMQAITKRL